MKKPAWTTRWYSLRPTTSSDEWFRHTLVIPMPLAPRRDEDGDLHWPALVLVTAPWWLCRAAAAADYRAYVRWHRVSTAAQFAVIDDDEAWELVFDAFERIRPPEPASFF